MPTIGAQFRPALVLLIAFTLLVGGAYPLLVDTLVRHAWIGQVSDTAIRDKSGTILASGLDAPPIDDPRYFWGKIVSRAAPDCYENHRSYAADCQALIKARIDALQAPPMSPVPDDLKAFGVPGQMPRISPEAASFQIHRVAMARGISDAQVTSLIETSQHNPTYELGSGVYVNVLELNLRLDGKLK